VVVPGWASVVTLRLSLVDASDASIMSKETMSCFLSSGSMSSLFLNVDSLVNLQVVCLS
jgi:hypothetical protein